MASSTAWDLWIEDAKAPDPLELARSLGARLKRNGSAEWSGPCPIDGGHDRFSVNTRKRLFNCRGSGGGDNITMVMHITGCSFNEACERLTGRPRPDNSRDETLQERQERQRAYAKRIAESQERREAEERDEAARARREEQAVADVIARAVPIEGTHAEAYLHETRKLTPASNLTIDLRFVPDLDYWGLPDDASDNLVHLATLPALIACIRDKYGAVIGFSGTYLDPERPEKWAPVGSPYNKAKKIRGDKRGGMIRLGLLSHPLLALGEGWENVLAWWQLGHGPEEASLAAAVDLGNLSGRSAGTIDHRWLKNSAKPRRIQNAMPDPDGPGVLIPKGVTSIILLGDSDSEYCATRAHVATAIHRFLDHGIAASVHWAPAGGDWNDALIAHLKALET